MNVNLSVTQQLIVDFEKGSLLVKAGPGSGKTRVLIERIKKILKSKKRSKILALTFSNLAAEEMKSRIDEDETIEDSNNVTIGTIHSFCLDVIQKRFDLLGFENEPVIFENESDRQKMLRDIFYENEKLRTILEKQENPQKFLLECLSVISDEKKLFVSPEESQRGELFKEMYAKYNDYLLSQNAIDFDDILFLTYKLLIENPIVVNMYNKIYDYYFIDEAQDLNYAQYMIIKTLCNKPNVNIMMVGDENQSIYGFNGSNSRFMCECYVEDFKPEIIVLHENFRSAKSIVRYANSLEETDSETMYYYEGELEINSFKNEDAEALYIVDKIKKLKDEGHKDIDHKLSYEDFAIIARNRFSLDNIANIMQQSGIDYYFKKSQTGIVLDSEFMNLFDLCLHMIINEKDMVHKKQISAMLKIENQDDWKKIIQSSKFEWLIDKLESLNKLLNFNNLFKDIENFFKDNQNFPSEEIEKILNDIIVYKKHWLKYCSQVAAEKRTIAGFKSFIALGKTQDNSNNKGVALLTAHMSKGLQFDVVFIISACEGVFPDYRAIKSKGKELEQEKNNMFVAVTRAKRLCYISYPRYRMMPWGDCKKQEPSRYISTQIINNF